MSAVLENDHALQVCKIVLNELPGVSGQPPTSVHPVTPYHAGHPALPASVAELDEDAQAMGADMIGRAPYVAAGADRSKLDTVPDEGQVPEISTTPRSPSLARRSTGRPQGTFRPTRKGECAECDPGEEPADTLAPPSWDQRKRDQRYTAYPRARGRRPPLVHETAEEVTDGFAPRYVFVPRQAGRLACGEMAIEPIIGAARVAQVRLGIHPGAGSTGDDDPAFDEEFVHVTWRDEHGPGSATGRYPAHLSFEVRMPDFADRLLVRRGIDQAVWLKREITDDTARLIAAHLHTGESSALHRFMIDGSIGERLYDELETAAEHRLYAREWIDALARYCLTREGTGPITSWTRQATNEAEARAEAWLTAAGVNVEELYHRSKVEGSGNGPDRPKRHRDLLSRKNMKTEIAAQLIDAAFTLGLEAGRSRASSRGARYLIRKDGLHEPGTP